MPASEPVRVGYILKMFPRFSETFILNEVLAHEAAGLDLQIFSLRPPDDAPLHGGMGRVRSNITYAPIDFEVGRFLDDLELAKLQFPGLTRALANEPARGLDFLDVYQAIWLAGTAKDSRLTHLHAHFGSMSATVARLASRISGIPYSFTAHAKDIFHNSVQQDDLHRKVEDANFVIAISEFNKAFLERTCVGAGRVVRLFNGLDLEQFPYAAPINRAPRIVAVGRLIEKKGFSDLVVACALLASQGRAVDCEIIGSGFLDPALRAQIDSLGLSGQVRLLGPLPQEEVIERVQAASMLVAPCVVGSDGNVDGLPTVLLEAMALGTPCISTDVTGIPEVLRHDITGLAVPQRAPADLAVAIARLLDDPALQLRLAGEARSLIEIDFDIRQNTAEMRSLFGVAKAAASVAAGRGA